MLHARRRERKPDVHAIVSTPVSTPVPAAAPCAAACAAGLPRGLATLGHRCLGHCLVAPEAVPARAEALDSLGHEQRLAIVQQRPVERQEPAATAAATAAAQAHRTFNGPRVSGASGGICCFGPGPGTRRSKRRRRRR